MTVKFRDPLSAQACVIVRTSASFHNAPSPLRRKWVADSLLVVVLKHLFILGSRDSNAVVQEKTLKEMEMKLRRDGSMTLQNGY